MTTELYPDDYFGGPDQYDYENDRTNEHCWLINEIIRPELPNIIDNVEKCIDMLFSDQVFKMPVSSGLNTDTPSPSIRGMVTRCGADIIDFQMALHFPQFNKGKSTIYRMNSGQKYHLPQLDSIGKYLQQILQLLEDLEVEQDCPTFINKFDRSLKLITQSINILQNPPQELMFPYNNNAIMKQMFTNYEELCESTHHEVSLELVVFKNELNIDFRNLNKVTKKPWCEIDPNTGVSLVDKVRESLKSDRGKKLNEILQEHNIHLEEASLLNNLMISAFNKESTTLQQAQEFIARCITFNGKVVTECEKLQITTSDPSLISITSKLNALEHTISNHFTNLEI
ncbi:regulator of V-ATPase in vacuolar membrane protein 2 [Monosporozyma servazzii]